MQDSKVGPKDILFQLLGTVALYWCAFNFGALLFSYIDLFLPDQLSYGHPLEGLRWALATLTVIFPVLVWVQRRLRRQAVTIPALQALRSRKWILYITLFLAGVIILGDIVAVLYEFLQGELTIRFLLKILSVLIISSAVLGLYLWQIKRDIDPKVWPWMEWVAKGVAALGVLVIVIGFFIIPSPLQERFVRFDERRVQDLQNIQWQVVNFWQQKARLPATLDELTDSISGYQAPRDSETLAAYEYAVKGELNFELCAIFSTELKTFLESTMPPQAAIAPKSLRATPYDTFDIWHHTKGRVCFERVIDKERYKVVK